jgi:transcription elongation factor SPT6
VRRLDRKPVSAFDDDQFLVILKAEKEGFLDVRISIPDEKEKQMLQEMELLYLSDGYSHFAHRWNEQRRLVLTEAWTKHLIPIFQSELRSSLAAAASDFVMTACGNTLRRLLMRGPYRPSYRRMDNGTKKKAIYWFPAYCL